MKNLDVTLRRPPSASVWPFGTSMGQCPDTSVAAAQLRACCDPQVYEGAVPYFSLAARVQPHEVKWQLMVASCYRRIGNYQQVHTANLLSASICSIQQQRKDSAIIRIRERGRMIFLCPLCTRCWLLLTSLYAGNHSHMCSSSIDHSCRSSLWAGGY